MKIFLSALESGGGVHDSLLNDFNRLGLTHFKWNLISYYYGRDEIPAVEEIRRRSDEILVDSGAHSFQKGATVDWLTYTRQYAEFIVRYDAPNVVGFFEMDVDNIIGYENVKELRKVLEHVSNKIIPVWHKGRGIEDFHEMCKTHKGRVVAVSGFKNEDIKDDQYLMFLKTAWRYGCSLHCLGMTRRKILDVVPFDYTDSSSWKQSVIWGRISDEGKITREFSRTKRDVAFAESYRQGMKMQEYYFERWRGVKERCLKEMI